MKVRARALSVRLGGRTLLHPLELELRAGEVLAIIGANGAGKSTLLSALAGDRRGATSGELWLDERRLESYSAAELATRRAVVRQHSTLEADFTVAEVVALGRAHSKRSAREACLREVGLFGVSARSYLTLSGGERARVHLARALHQLGEGKDGLLLLDEPTAALDAREQHRALAVVRDRARRGLSAAVIVHDLALAASYADRVAVLAGGRLLACEEPARALTPELLRAAFGIAFELVHTARGPVPLALTPPG